MLRPRSGNAFRSRSTLNLCACEVDPRWVDFLLAASTRRPIPLAVTNGEVPVARASRAAPHHSGRDPAYLAAHFAANSVRRQTRLAARDPALDFLGQPHKLPAPCPLALHGHLAKSAKPPCTTSCAGSSMKASGVSWDSQRCRIEASPSAYRPTMWPIYPCAAISNCPMSFGISWSDYPVVRGRWLERIAPLPAGAPLRADPGIPKVLMRAMTTFSNSSVGL